MIAPTFEPGGAPGQSIEKGARQATLTQSWMDRQQARELQAEELRLRQQQEEQNRILMPVHMAKANADLITTAATIASAERLQQLRSRAAIASQDAEKELISATNIPDWDQQDAALATLQAKYAWMETVPEYKPLVDTINTSRAKSVQMMVANKHIEGLQAAADARAAGQLAVETEKSTSAKDRQTADLAHKREVDELTKQIAELKASTSEKVGAGHDTARTESASTTAGSRVQSSAGRVFAEEADTLEKAAQNEMDPEAKTILQRKAQAYRDKSEKAVKAAPAADAGQPTVAPTVVDKDATSVSVGGKTYPIYKDAQGNRAYKVDGHFVPLSTK